MSVRYPNRGAGEFYEGGRPVVLLTEREATAVLERLQAVMSGAEQQGESDLGRASRVLALQLEWLTSETRGSGRARVDAGAA